MTNSIQEIVTVTISKDKMQATVNLNCSQVELREKQEFFIGEILRLLLEQKVTEGIKMDLLQGELEPQKEYIIAKGIAPIDGEDARIEYFAPTERRPTIRTDGKADFYDMNFIDEIRKGAWLGEKIPATDGSPGKTVTGELVVQKKGRDMKLLYDRRTVAEVVEGEKIVLRALTDGVLTFKDGKIAVGSHLMIDGDVGVETGNIDFDGSVTIKGIVQPGYSVKATKDVSILGELGLSKVKMVTSVSGDIFIKGGVFGQGESTIKAGKNIFIKHANNCILLAKGDIHIGYYSIGSYLKGRNIFADEKNSKIIGGKIEAKGKIVASIIGNRMERKTWVSVEGFNRESLTEQLVEKLLQYKKEALAYEGLKKHVEAYENSKLTEEEHLEYLRMLDDLDAQLAKVSELDENCKEIANLLEVKGEGEVTIKEVAYPETFIEIQKIRKRISSEVKGTFYIDKGVLRFE
ncbi:DUF342 domain-containing protein [Robertmurraya andreesenii]|uniref:Uncharacterized protein (DUF342 family) n=1 Tax=Anoxybacillus andreesenii TaxID=1325932 RepID=A0ABT9V675_9BACL|nr:FapA family protein [Robertmurraya andreesenii]MDQ0156448.1 uncharacterized protein (DUF342 family) [Robertmurraya andreesenii]